MVTFPALTVTPHNTARPQSCHCVCQTHPVARRLLTPRTHQTTVYGWMRPPNHSRSGTRPSQHCSQADSDNSETQRHRCSETDAGIDEKRI